MKYQAQSAERTSRRSYFDFLALIFSRQIACAFTSILLVMVFASIASAMPFVIDPVLVNSTYLGGNSSEVTTPTASHTLSVRDHPLLPIESPPLINTAAIVTWNGSQDNHWSNPGNWEGSRVPGKSDVARFAANSGPEVLVDADSSGTVAGLILEPDYDGTLSLKRDLSVTNDLVLAGGTLDQGNYGLSVSHYRQTGGTFIGGDASLTIQNEATLSGGKLLTSTLTTARSLTIMAPAVVTMAANGKLNLTGDGEPLSGNGLLDVTTNGPNSLEYTGRATSDVTTAKPLKGALGAAVSAQSALPFAIGGAHLPFGLGSPLRPPVHSKILGLTPLEPSRAFGNEGHVRSQRSSLIQSLSPQLPSQPLSGSFSRSAALTLAQNEVPNAVAIDRVNGFAYFGTSTSVGPGAVVKVRLSDFTRVGVLVLTGEDDAPGSAVIDTDGGFVYFGGYNGDIIKVRLSDFTRVGVIETGTGFQSAAVIDTNNGFAYFGSFTSPGGVYKVRLSDFTIVDVLVLNTDEIGILSGVIDTVNGFAYFGTYNNNNINNPTFVVKVRLSDFTRVGNLQLPAYPNGQNPTCGVIDTANGYAYFGLFESHEIIKVRLSDLTLASTITPNGDVQFLRSAVIDTVNGYAYFGDVANKVVKLRLSDFSVAGVLAAPSDDLFCAAIDTANGFAYFGGTTPQGVVKVRLSDFSLAGFTPLSYGEDNLTAAVIDAANGFAYFATGITPGVVKVRLSDFTRVGVLAFPPGNYRLVSGAIDTANGFAYFGSDGNTGKVVKIRLPDFTLVSTLTLNSGDSDLYSAAIDPAAGFAYFGALTSSAGRLVKVRLSDFTRVGSVTLNQNESPWCMTIDATNGFAYLGTNRGYVVKVRLSDLTRVGALSFGQDQIRSAVADPSAGFAYFGTVGGNVLRVRLSDFSDAFGRTVGTNLQSAAIDTVNGFAYFGTFTTPGRVAKVNLSNWSTESLTLNAGEDYLSSAVMDTANGFAYFGTSTRPGIVVKIQLDDLTPTIRAAFDFDGDGKTDPSVYRPSAGDWYLLNTTTGFRALHFGLPSDLMVPADYTGDGKTDMAVWRPSDSIWYVLRSEDNTFYGAGFGASGDVPAPGDYDGDGKADLVVIRPGASQSYWYLQQSTAGFAVVPFGLAGDVPTLGDYDGDGKNDVAVYRPSAGAWFRFNSSNGSFLGVGFGISEDKVVPADYTGDGKTDLAVFRPSDNIWYILRSEDNSLTGGAFGALGDLPSPGDYDGDGKADLAVYRLGATPGAQSVFYVLQTTAGFNTIPWGLGEDRPVPGAYVY